MDLKTLVEYRNLKQYASIIREAEGKQPEDISDLDIKMVIAEAYLKQKQYRKSVCWYLSCLTEASEECARKLIYIFKNQNDGQALQDLYHRLQEVEVSPGIVFLCEYEYLRSNDAEQSEQIEVLKEYVTEEYDALYTIKLAELYLKAGDERNAKRFLKQCLRLYPSSEYSEMSEELLNALAEKRVEEYIEKHTVELLLYEKLEEVVPEKINSVPEFPKTKAEKNESSRSETHIEAKTISLADRLKKGRKHQKRKKYVNEEPLSIEERFKDIYGMKEAREALGNFYRMLRMESGRRDSQLEVSLLNSTHFTIAGKKATGKTLLAQTIHKLLCDFGIREQDEAILIDARELENNFDNLMNLDGETLIIENIEKCAGADGTYSQESFLWQLRRLMKNKMDSLSIIITGSQEGIQQMLLQEAELNDLIYKNLEIPEYSLDEIFDIAISLIKKRQFLIDDAGRIYIKRILQKQYRKSGFEGAYTIEKMITEAISRMADRVETLEDSSEMDFAMLTREDFIGEEDESGQITKLLEQLDGMTGLKSVKEVVKKKITEVLTLQEQEEKGIQSNITTSRHLVFYGNPGTGKTTVARIIGQIYYYLGILPENKIVECSVSDLVAEHVGGTSMKTKAVIAKAIGGVLFIDEAYGLSSDKSQFNDQAVDEIIKGMEDHREELMIIMAGYKNSMDHFFQNTNEGLKGRFPEQNRITFEDYTLEEMVDIFKRYVSNADLLLEENTEDILISLLEEKSKVDGFDNARGVRNVFDYVSTDIRNQRLEKIDNKTRDDYRLITRQDLETALGSREELEKQKSQWIEELQSMTGLATVKEELGNILKEIEANLFYSGISGEHAQEVNIDNFLFLGNPGTGKTTVARIFSKILEQLGVLKKKNHFIECTREDFVSPYVGQTAEKTRKLVERAYGGILFIDEAYCLCKDANDSSGREAVDTLLKLMEDHRDELIVIAAGYTEEMHKFLEANKGMRSRFQKDILFEDYTREEMLSIFLSMAEKEKCMVSKDCHNPLQRHFDTLKTRKNFGNAREVRTLFENMQTAMKIRCFEMHQKGMRLDDQMVRTITVDDLLKVTGNEMDLSEGGSVEELLEQIEGMIGLQRVKEDLYGLVRFIQGIKKEKGDMVNIAEEVNRMHMVFQGPPGTGKTTIARLVGKIYRELGILKSDVFVECDRSSLVGAVVGETEVKTNKKIDEAMGGVLFVDEAYALAGQGNDYGKQAINVLLKRMEDERHDFMVILAGYTEDMAKLFEMNQGFISRVPNTFTFENYTNEELIAIFHLKAKKSSMLVSEDVYEILIEYFERKRNRADFANARDVEILFDKVKRQIYQQIGESDTVKRQDGMLVIGKEILLSVVEDMD